MKDAGTTWQNSPVKVLAALVLLIMCVESGIMFLLRKFVGELPVVAEMLADSALLVGILCPALFSLVLVPLLRQITERRQAENALRTSEERYRTLIDSVDGIVWEADAATFRFTLVSSKAEHILGYPARRWIDEPDFWVGHLHPEDREWAVNYCLVATKNLKDHDFEYRMLAADGRTVWLRDIVSVVAERGEAKTLRGLMVDVTERKDIELALAASEKRYRFLADNLRDVIWEMDGALAFTFTSHSVMEVFGYAQEELLGREVGTVLTAASRQKVAGIISDSLARQAATGAPFATISDEFECLRKDGTVFWAEVRAKLIVADGGRLEKVVGMTRDITERVQSEERIRASLAEKELLLREIHHRVRNNLQIITGLLALQAEQGGDDGSSLFIRGSQNRIFALSLIYEVLSSSSSLTRVNLDVYIRSLLGYLSDSFRVASRGVSIEIEAEEVLLDIDTAIPCGLIINELVANAFRFAFPGGRRGTIRVRIGRESEKRIVLAVVDDGVGLPEGMAIDSIPTLGLRLVKLLVAQLEGNLKLTNGDGLECLITFDLH